MLLVSRISYTKYSLRYFHSLKKKEVLSPSPYHGWVFSKNELFSTKALISRHHLVVSKSSSSKHYYDWRLCLTGMITVLTSSLAINHDKNDMTRCKEKKANNNKDYFRLIDSYEVETVLGEGAFGKVYKALSFKEGKDVALKVISRNDTDGSDFQREIDALEFLKEHGGHPHICNMIDYHDDGKLYYVSMELIEGGELFEHLIEKGPYSEAKAANFVRQFSEALNFIHKLGMIHGDLKPENLMLSSWVDETAQIKVVDFGCSRHQIEEVEDTENAQGTLAYWAPELFKKGSQPSQKADIWASGCILYILLTGTHPFDPHGNLEEEEVADNVMLSAKQSAIGKQYLDNNVFQLKRVGRLGESCVSLLRQMLEPDPKKRITSKEFLAHPWVQGLTASYQSIPKIDEKLEHFWQKRFRRVILKKYARAIFGSSLSETKELSYHNLTQIFNSMDKDGNGVLDKDEVEVALKDLGVDPSHIPTMFSAVDLEKNNVINFDEFEKVMRMKVRKDKLFQPVIFVTFAVFSTMLFH